MNDKLILRSKKRSTDVFFICGVFLFIGIIFGIFGCGGGGDGDNPVGSQNTTPVWNLTFDMVQNALASHPEIHWLSAQTSVTRNLSQDQAKIMNGLIEERAPSASLLSFALPPSGLRNQSASTALPLSFSWANHQGYDWNSTIKDQGPFGTCVAFACCAALETNLKISENNPLKTVDLAEWFLWYKGSGQKNPNPGGWYLSSASEFLKSGGVVAESYAPYAGISAYPTFSDPPSNEPRHVVQNWFYAVGTDSMKTALMSGPLIAGMNVYEDFFYYSSGVYKHVIGNSAGNHAILIIGYDDYLNCWIGKNSWSTGWGENGFFRIAYGEISGYGLAYTVASPASSVSPKVMSVFPAENAQNVATSTLIQVIFNVAMASSSFDDACFHVSTDNDTISGDISFSTDRKTLTFTPATSLPPNATITVAISTQAEDLTGNPLAEPKSWRFLTVTGPDLTPPRIINFTPADNAVNIPRDQPLTIYFSEPVTPSSVTNSSFLVLVAGTPVEGEITLGADGKTASFTSSYPFPYSSTVTIIITSEIQDLAGNTLASNTIWNFTIEKEPDLTPPSIDGVIPADNALNVAYNEAVTVYFSEPMASNTINSNNIIILNGSTPLSSLISLSDDRKTATLRPTTDFPFEALITVFVTTGVKDSAGNSLPSNKIWTFTTGSAPDLTPPTVAEIFPTDNQTDIPTDAIISVALNEPISPSSLNDSTFLVASETVTLTGSISISPDGKTAYFTPSLGFPYDSRITVSLTTGINDLAGNHLSLPKTWSFNTMAEPDIIPPSVVGIFPEENANNVATESSIMATFSEALDPSTLTESTFVVLNGGSAIPGNLELSPDKKTAVFTAAAGLPAGAAISIILTTDLKDISGNSLTQAKTWNFTTCPAPAVSLPAITGFLPASGATDLATATLIAIIFSKPIDPTTLDLTTVTLSSDAIALNGAISLSSDGMNATFTPIPALPYGSQITAAVSSEVRDLSGNPLGKSLSWTFSTAIQTIILETFPADGASDVPGTTSLSLRFNRPVDISTLGSNTFSLTRNSDGVVQGWSAVSFSPDHLTATFTTADYLDTPIGFTGALTTEVHDALGFPLENTYSFSFTTKAWTILRGNAGGNQVEKMSSDLSGNLYLSGTTEGDLDGNPNPGAATNMFLMKLDSNGAWQWTRQLGTTFGELGGRAGPDSIGNIFIPGTTNGDFDGGVNAGGADMFVVKYDTTGAKLWSRQLGSAGNDHGTCAAADSTGNVYVTGSTDGDYDGNIASGLDDIFITKYDAGGLKQWSKQYGTTDADVAMGIAFDTGDNFYLTGYTKGNLDGASNQGDADVFLMKCDSAGNIIWTRLLGTSAEEWGKNVAIDSSGKILVTGWTYGDLDGEMNQGGRDVFIAQFDAGGVKQWIRIIGSSADEYSSALTSDVSRNIYVGGATTGDLSGRGNAGGYDVFTAKFDPTGNRLWVKTNGTIGTDEGKDLCIGAAGQLWVAGSTDNNLDLVINNGGCDIFLMKYSTDGYKY